MACCKIPTEFLDSPYPHLPSLDSALLYSFACSYFPTKTCASAPAIEIIRCTRSFTAICDWLHERLEKGCDGLDLPSRSERTGTSRECGSLCEGRDVHIQKLMLLVISAPVNVFFFCNSVLVLFTGFIWMHLCNLCSLLRCPSPNLGQQRPGFLALKLLSNSFPSHCAGVNMIQQGTQVRANCFHFWRQVQVLSRAGGGSAESQFSEAKLGNHRVLYFWEISGFINKWTTASEINFSSDPPNQLLFSHFRSGTRPHLWPACTILDRKNRRLCPT